MTYTVSGGALNSAQSNTNLILLLLAVVAEGSLVPSMRETGSEGRYTVNH